jgi:flavin reductase (DIM6/NTAB) family NADH-FMN oxidoreductase RutF
LSKIALGPRTLIYPMPALLIGAQVNGKPNFMTVAWSGIVDSDPPMISVSIRHQRHTLVGIRQNMTFSVNVPSTDIVAETDYCGTASGNKTDKTAVCHFGVFYGKLVTAPLVEQCPVNLECSVEHVLNLGTHSLVIGKIQELYVTEDCLTDGKPDVTKIKPFCFVGDPDRQYRALGDVVAKAYSVGTTLKSRE